MPKHLHPTHPRLEFWVTVVIHEREARDMATADLGEDSRDVGVGDTPKEAVREALRSLGEPYAREMSAKVNTRACWTLPRRMRMTLTPRFLSE
jgi:hypothetical protein